MKLNPPLKYHKAEIRHVTKGTRPRRKPSDLRQQTILEQQNDHCFYCGLKFYEWYHDGRYARERSVCWDHLLPYNYSQNSHDYNFVAACGQCNGIKRDKIFHNLKEAAEYVRKKRRDKGLPNAGVWGNKLTQGVFKEQLFIELSKTVFEPVNEDSSIEELQQKQDEMKVCLKFLKSSGPRNRRRDQ